MSAFLFCYALYRPEFRQDTMQIVLAQNDFETRP
jgi:hypothetical protein